MMRQDDIERTVTQKIASTTPTIDFAALANISNHTAVMNRLPVFKTLHHHFDEEDITNLKGLPDEIWQHILFVGDLQPCDIVSFILCCRSAYNQAAMNEQAQQTLFNAKTYTPITARLSNGSPNMHAQHLSVFPMTFFSLAVNQQHPNTQLATEARQELSQPGEQGFVILQP